ncbi:MAG: cytochrome c oxidase assembly protein [Acidipropionibacterium sp.]|jgi:putative copper resistance protein D|nr:cytochrome c oxidase assembly protein [Acidipropionibacterium sp.]
MATSDPAHRLWPVLVAVAMAVAAGLIGSARRLEPRLLGRADPDLLTSILHAMTATAAWTALVLTLAQLLLATVLGSRDQDHQGAPSPRITRQAWLTSQAWTIAALLMVPLEAADSSGLPTAEVIGDLPSHLASTPSVTAWFAMAVIGLITSLVCLLCRSVGGLLLISLAVIASALPVIVTGSVSVGLNHDFSTDAGAICGVATVIACAIVAARLLGGPDGAPARVARTRAPLMVCLAVALAGQLVVTWQGLAGTSPLDSRWGIGRLVLLIALAGWLVLTWIPRRLPGWPAALPVAVVLVITGASSQLIPPRYLVPQTAVVNYLGYNLPGPPTVGRLLLPGRPNLLMLFLAVAAAVSYLLAVRRVRRDGRKWYSGRIVAWLIGWAVVAYLGSSGLWKYSSITFSWHMLVHMLVNMLVPALLVLAAPITLLRSVLTDRPRECLESLLHWRPTTILFGPFAGWAVFTASFYAVYFTPIFGLLMRYHWGHQWMLLHFMAAGLLLFEYVIGLDELPTSLPHIGRLGFIITAMPFHSFFAVIVMSTKQIIGADYYETLAVPWVRDLAANQNLGGQLTWAAGEPPMAVVLIALCVQWFLADKRDQKKIDAAEDEGGLEASLTAYNEMLAQMAGQDDQDGPGR